MKPEPFLKKTILNLTVTALSVGAISAAGVIESAEAADYVGKMPRSRVSSILGRNAKPCGVRLSSMFPPFKTMDDGTTHPGWASISVEADGPIKHFGPFYDEFQMARSTGEATVYQSYELGSDGKEYVAGEVLPKGAVPAEEMEHWDHVKIVFDDLDQPVSFDLNINGKTKRCRGLEPR